MCVDRAQIHTNVRLQDGRLVEIQVRTAAMHERAERGSAAHHLYKGGLGASSAAQRELGHSATRAVSALLPAANANAAARTMDVVSDVPGGGVRSRV